MEHVHRRDDNWSPPLTAGSTAPLSQVDPLLLTPNTRESDTGETIPYSQYTDKSQIGQHAGLGHGASRSKPLLQGFERPSFPRIAILTVLCLSAYPAFYVLTLVARDKSLFLVRLIVSVWCSGVGFALGYFLIRIGVQHLEAASK